MISENSTPTNADPSLDSAPPAPRYLLPASGGDISVGAINYGGKSMVHELVEAVILSLLIFLLVGSAVQNRVVLGSSMEPSLHNDERLFIDRVSYFRFDANFLARLLGQADTPADLHYLLTGPQRGDIVVFQPPVESWSADHEDYIKRVIGLPGERVEVRGGEGVYINGQRLDELYIKEVPDYNWGPQVVPPDQLFVLGDNRRNSSDSHIWGFLDVTHVVGRAWISYWPRDEWGILPHPAYAGFDAAPAAP